jgi:molybdenum cofactor cytidylyltransferase
MGCLLKGGGGLYSRLVVGAVVLAAGAGARLGHRPKCLLELGGVALIRRQLIALSGAGVDELVVVLGHHAEAIEPALQDFPITVVRNPTPDAGQASSLRTGLAALGGKLDAVLVVLADHPMLGAQDMTQLIGAYKKRPEGSLLVYPQVDGEPGNPVILSTDLRELILDGGVDVACRQWRADHPDLATPFVTPNKRFGVDIDSAEDLARFEARTGHRLSWPAAWADPAADELAGQGLGVAG